MSKIPVLKYAELSQEDMLVCSPRSKRVYEENFKIIKELLYKGYTVSKISEITGIAIRRIYDIFKFKGLVYDSNIGKTYATKKNNILTVEKVSTSIFSNKDKLYDIHCSVCSKDVELFPQPFTSSIERLNLGKIPCACSGNYAYNKDQKVLRLVRVIKNKDYIIKSLDKKTFCYDCLECGVTNKNMRYNSVLNNGGKLNCKCSGGYVYTDLQERLLDLNKILSKNNMTSLTAIDYDEITKQYTFTCNKCTLDYELWGCEKFTSTKVAIDRGIYPCGCKKVPAYSEEQHKLLVMRRCSQDGFIFNGFVGDYLKTQTLLSITCQNGHTRNSTKIAQFLDKNTNRCVECKSSWARDLYASDEEEVKRSLLDSMLPQHTFLGFCGGEFINQNQRFRYFCAEKGKEYQRYIRSFLDGSKGNCCVGGGFKESQKGYLYLVKWYDESKDFQFYKYGISNHNPLKRIRKQAKKTKAKHQYVGGYLFDKGGDAVLLENRLKEIYKNRRVSFEDLPDGYTETIYNDDFTTKDILWDFVYLTGIDVLSGIIHTVDKEQIQLPFKGSFTYITFEHLVNDLGGKDGV